MLGEEPLHVDGYILEAVFSSVERAVENRLEMSVGAWGRMLAPLLYLQIPLRLGVELEALRPSEAIKSIKAPVLIINGTNDQKTTLNEARLMFENAPEPKEFYEVVGAAHTNLYAYDREKYEQSVLSFLAKHVRNNPFGID